MSEAIRYRRAKFATRLLGDRLYTAGHAWLAEESPGLWRIGLTKFAIRMLGEAVELDFEIRPGAAIEKGDVLGWIEGFKAVTDLYSPLGGVFHGQNDELLADPELLKKDPFGRGYLYRVEGRPDEDCVDVQGYVAILDATIDKMLGESGGADNE
jgi:glycine cleavage system H protein